MPIAVTVALSCVQKCMLTNYPAIISLGCGTTWHSAGLLGSIRGSRAHTKLTTYSNELYSNLEESGHGTGTTTNLYVHVS